MPIAPLTISQIDELIDASYKRKDIPQEDRQAVRDKLRATRKQIVDSLDQRTKFDTAEDLIKSLGKPKKKFKKAKFGDERVVVCGSTNWSDKSKIRLALKTLPLKDTRWLIIGTSKGAEQLSITVGKALKHCIVQMHPQQHLGNSATHVRNNEVFRLFKPTKVIAFHNDIEASTSTKLFLKLAQKQNIPRVLITKEDNAKSISKKMASAGEK